MKFISIYGAVSLFILTAYAALIPSASSNNPQDYTVFKWEKNSYSKSFSVNLNALSRIHISDLNADGKGFSVYDNGKLIGKTTVDKKRIAIPDSKNKYHYRQGYFDLKKGHHLIKLELNKPAKGKGSGMIRIITGKSEEYSRYGNTD